MSVRILLGDCRERLRALPDGVAQTCVTSPPYFGLRDYGVDGQMGLEATPDEFIAGMVEVFREVRRVLRDDGTLWLNLGDSYVTTPPGNKRAPQDDDGLYQRRQEMQIGHGEDRGAIWACGKSTGLANKNLIGMPWRVALALQADGWILRQDIIWAKPNPMPESVRDRCTKSHEYIFLLSKGPRYYFDADAIAEGLAAASVARLAQDVEAQAGSLRVPGKTNGAMKAVGGRPKTKNSFAREAKDSGGVTGAKPQFRTDRDVVSYEGRRNKRSVWTVATQPFKEAHFATYPPELIEPCILAGAPKGGLVLDPFGGAGTTGLVADRLGRDALLIELNPEYAEIARKRLTGDAGMFAQVEVAA